MTTVVAFLLLAGFVVVGLVLAAIIDFAHYERMERVRAQHRHRPWGRPIFYDWEERRWL